MYSNGGSMLAGRLTTRAGAAWSERMLRSRWHKQTPPQVDVLHRANADKSNICLVQPHVASRATRQLPGMDADLSSVQICVMSLK